MNGNNFTKPHALNTFSDCFMHVKFQIFSTKLNKMVKVVKLFPGVLRKSCSDEFYRKTPMQESLF